jgi:hypothetical protein
MKQLRLAAAALILWVPAALAQFYEIPFVDPGLRWRTLETASFAVHFAEQHRAQARVVAGVAEQVLPRITALLRWKPRSRIHLVVLDSADLANGFASPLPFNFSMVFLAPPDEGELLQNRDWLELLLSHELFHVVHLDMARGAPQVLRNIFGRQWFSFPNALAPGWMIEGLAVHHESDAKLAHGRLRNSYFEAMMRAEVARGLRSLPEVNAGGRGFPLNRDYLYGSYFYAFLEERYGPSAIQRFVENYSDNFVPFRVHSNPVIVTDKNMNALWAEYHDWLKQRFATPRSEPREGEVIARDFSIGSPLLTADGARWYVRADGYTRPKLVREAPGAEPEVLRQVEQGARLSGHAEVLVAQYDICDNYNYYYDLHRLDARGRMNRITDCGRYRFAEPLEDGRIAALRIEAGATQALALDSNGKPAEVLYRAAPGESLTGIAAKGDSIALTSLRAGRWSVIRVRGGAAEILLTDQAIKHSPRIGEGDEVFFVADYGKVFNVWSLGGGGQLARWTNAAHGVREISAPRGREMLLTTIEADGDALRLYRLPAAPLEELSAMAPAPAPMPPQPSVEARDQPYSPWESLLPRNWLPIVEIVDGAFGVGVATFGQDALARHQYVLAPQFELTQQELLGSLLYLYNDRHLIALNRSMTVKSTVDDEIETYTTSEAAQWVSTWRSLRLNRRFYWGLGAALERERLRVADGPTVSASADERVVGLVAGFDSRRAQWLSEGPSQGLQIRLFAETSQKLGGTYSGDVYRGDSRLHLPLWHTVLALRWNEAWGEIDAEPFDVGGYDPDPGFLLPLLNQRDFPLRGYKSGDMSGHRARIGSAELRVPLKDVDRHAMVPPVGINRVSVNLFYEVGAAWEGRADPDYKRSVGIELLSELSFGYNIFGAQARLGVARGIDDPGTTRWYLTVGRAF